ncbi:MAG: ribonuclease HII [Oscillospiraceae bacterium]|nr:ribonuclease HII [Oscillospiraceae bacterium]
MTLYEFDQELRQKYATICGVDEAGRGPLAGDVYAAAVVFDEGVIIEGINDSKKLTEKKREKLFDEIIEKASAYCIATASVAEIEEINILNAAMLAMKRAVEGLGVTPDIAIIDGNKTPDLFCLAKSVVKGDATSQSIAAASILAKVARDRYMLEMAEKYPEYQFEKHKGYGTKAHYQALKEHGLSPVHRPSFLKNLGEK